MVKSLGADHIIDYTIQDALKTDQKYDIIFAARYSRPVKEIADALRPEGIYVSTSGGSLSRLYQEFIKGPQVFDNEHKTIAVIRPGIERKDLDFLRELIEAGRLKPVIDRVYPLERTAEAFKYYGKGHAKGKVVISIKPEKRT